jgi:hypothetical protein
VLTLGDGVPGGSDDGVGEAISDGVLVGVMPGVMLAGRHRQPNPTVNKTITMMAILDLGIVLWISIPSSRYDADATGTS